jgi:hypothetical protein
MNEELEALKCLNNVPIKVVALLGYGDPSRRKGLLLETNDAITARQSCTSNCHIG